MADNGLFSVLQATLTLIDLMLMSMAAANHLSLILTVTLTLMQFDEQSSAVVLMSLSLVLMGDSNGLSQMDHSALAPKNLSSLRLLMTGYPEEPN